MPPKRHENIPEDEKSTRTYVRDLVEDAVTAVEKKGSREYEPVKNEINNLSAKSFYWVMGLIITALLSFGVWITSSIYDHSSRLKSLEEKQSEFKEMKQDIKDIKEALVELKIKVVQIEGKINK